MTIETRSPFKFKSPGPYLAIVKNHLDPGYMGGFEVALIKGQVDNTEAVSAQSLKVKYMTPFYGATPITSVNPDDARDFGSTQKSYGMWMVPPDIGTTVMVIFIGGDSNQGYWLGCVPDPYMNYMVPGLAAQELPATWLTSSETIEYGGENTYLPVAEFNRKATKANVGNPANIPRPIHPFAKKLAAQGLLADRIRGVTSSSARREIPSMVFGISTPGPLDPNGPTRKVAYDGRWTDKLAGRLGGSTFVMDDGDESGQNELVRIRTRTGHQILMHNTEDLIYIANGAGTTWIELTAQGKIDIYAQDSISIHTEESFNFRAKLDVNIEAGRNINLHSFGETNIESKEALSLLSLKSAMISGSTQILINSNGNAVLGGKVVGLEGNTSINMTAPKISSNGPPSPPAGQPPDQLFELNEVPYKLGKDGSWENEFDAGTLNTFLQRVPTHEPWPQHENKNPEVYTAYNLDTIPPASGSDYTPGTPPNSKLTTVDSVGALVFTGGSGDAAHFAKTTPELKAALTNAAVAFKTKTGRPVVITSTYRSTAEQQALYNKWIAAGGGPNNPKAGGIYTPVNPASRSWPNAHNRGIAFDSPQAAELDKLGILKAYGMYRPVPNSDPVHAVLRNPPPVVSRPTSNQPTTQQE
jgi:hypothetical protein